MFEFCRKYTKLLIPILLGLFFATFVVDDYGNEPRKMKGVCMECIAEMEADETEWEEDDLPEEAYLGKYSLEINGTECVFLCSMNLSSSQLSAEQFRGLVRRYAPRPIPTYINLNNNGMDLFQVCAIFYSENQILKLWTLQAF